MSEILQVQKGVSHINDITSKQYHTYTPYTTAFNNNDEIRIAIQSRDLYVQPSDSYLFIEFTVEGLNATTAIPTDASFAYALGTHFFQEMRYELNGVEIDRCKTPAITTLMKTMVACKSTDRSALQLMTVGSRTPLNVATYRILLPLRLLFGFCDDYTKIVLNCKHELILIRSRTDHNAYKSKTGGVRFNIDKIHWKMSHIALSDAAKLNMLKTIERREEIPISFRSWDLYELPKVAETTRHIWSVKTTTQLTKPRYVAVALQTNRQHVINMDACLFDHCKITNMRLFLNNERYPYDDLNLDFDRGHYCELFNMMNSVQHEYYNATSDNNPLDTSPEAFQNVPLFVFDCSRSDESITNGMVDVRIELDAHENIPPNTTAFCLIIHDNLLRYSPSTNVVHRDI